MSKNLLQMMGLSLIVAVVATCTDQTPTAAPNDDAERLVPTLGSALACDLTSSTQIPADVRNYFSSSSNTVRNAARDKASQLGSACGAGNEALTRLYALQLIGMVETLVEAPPATVPSVVLGGTLVRKLLTCTTSLGCTTGAYVPADVPLAADLAKALDAQGLFTVRQDGTPALARGTIPFFGTNAAKFGTELSAGWTWPQANGGGTFVLLYGYPTAPSFVGEAKVATLGYSFNRWPDSLTPDGKFKDDGIVHVGVCFKDEIDVPHLDGVEHSHGRMQREGTLLSYHTPGFCGQAGFSLQASLAAPARALAMSLLPTSWAAMFFGDVRTPVIGGSAWDFSDFAPVGANTAGRLVIEAAPAAGSFINVGDALNIRVLALSGGGTPMERVPVEIYVAGNQGTPAGAVVMPDPLDEDPDDGDGTWGYTVEDGGTVTLTGSLGKPGGYTICARLKPTEEFPGFTFAEACTLQFQVKQ